MSHCLTLFRALTVYRHVLAVALRRHAAVAPPSIVPASHYVQAHLLLADHPQPAGERILAALDDLVSPASRLGGQG